MLFLIQKFSHIYCTDFEVLEEGEADEDNDGLGKTRPEHWLHHGAMVSHLHSVRQNLRLVEETLVQPLGKVG